MLLVGVAVGSGFARAGDVRSAPGSIGGVALVGMAAMTAASIHAPLPVAVLVFELSGDYAIVLPRLLATAIATSVSTVPTKCGSFSPVARRSSNSYEMRRTMNP